MHIKKINNTQKSHSISIQRPQKLWEFVGQNNIKKILEVGIQSAITRKSNLWHILFSGPSGYGKTTLAQIVAAGLWVNIKIITGYAISKPSEMISVLNSLNTGDILFIDEIHRLKSSIEEVLYIAMEDFVIDMVMPEWWNLRIPINHFTLIGATTKLENLTSPFKNRFIYKFHFQEYNNHEKESIISRYLWLYNIKADNSLLWSVSSLCLAVPREIHNLVIQIRDFLISHIKQSESDLKLNEPTRSQFCQRCQIQDGGLTPLHRQYLAIVGQATRPIWLRTIAIQLWIHEQSVEQDIEPLLFKLGYIDKTAKWRIILQ